VTTVISVKLAAKQKTSTGHLSLYLACSSIIYFHPLAISASIEHLQQPSGWYSDHTDRSKYICGTVKIPIGVFQITIL